MNWRAVWSIYAFEMGKVTLTPFIALGYKPSIRPISAT